MDLAKIIAEFNAVATSQQWQHLHTPKNLVSAIAVEVGELQAHFQWLLGEGSEQAQALSTKKNAVAEEVADVFMYLLMLTEKLDIDFEQAVLDKIEVNRKRFISSGLKNK